MTTKQNTLRLPGAGPNPIKPRIVIEIDPAKGGSLLKTYGPVTIPMVIDALMAQMASMWGQFIKSMTTQLTDPNTGQPALKAPEKLTLPEAEPEPKKNGEDHTPHDYTFQGDDQ